MNDLIQKITPEDATILCLKHPLVEVGVVHRARYTIDNDPVLGIYINPPFFLHCDRGRYMSFAHEDGFVSYCEENDRYFMLSSQGNLYKFSLVDSDRYPIDESIKELNKFTSMCVYNKIYSDE